MSQGADAHYDIMDEVGDVEEGVVEDLEAGDLLDKELSDDDDGGCLGVYMCKAVSDKMCD
jgi:hypothetical protein